MKELPSQGYLKECFEYNPETGDLTWRHRPQEHFNSYMTFRTWNGRWAGKPALNSIGNLGYKEGCVNSIRVHAHRIIYKIVAGVDPNIIDHENGNKSDNRFFNLKSGTVGENGMNKCLPENNTSGVIGVYWYPPLSKWSAKIKKNQIQKFLGYFEDFDDAVAARKAAEIELGFHKNHGRVK